MAKCINAIQIAIQMKKLTRHHRRCKSNGGTNEASNISMVTEEQHRAYHLLFKNHPPQVVASILTHTWIDSRFKLVCVLKD